MWMSEIIKENCKLIAFLRDAIRGGSCLALPMNHPEEICYWAAFFGVILGKLGRRARTCLYRFCRVLYSS